MRGARSADTNTPTLESKYVWRVRVAFTCGKYVWRESLVRLYVWSGPCPTKNSNARKRSTYD